MFFALIGALWIRLFRPVGFSKSANVSMEKIAGIFKYYYLDMFEDGSADLIIQRFLYRYLHEVDAEPNELSNSATDVEALSKSQTSLSKCFYTH